MANRERNEYTLTVTRSNNDKQSLSLVFNNDGYMEAEDFLGDAGDDIEMKIAQLRFSRRILTALMWGATRKHHLREIPERNSLSALMDDIYEQFGPGLDSDDMLQYVWSSLMASWTRRNIEWWQKLFNGENPDAEETSGEAPKGKGKGPQKVPEQESA